jgi:flagellar assembly protein FliH
MSTAAPAPARFTFDLDLGTRQRGGGRPMSDSALDTMLKEARDEGIALGHAEAERSATGRLAAAADSVAASAGRMAAALEEAQKAAVANAIDLAAAIARKLALTLIESQPLIELEALIAECLTSIESAPHLVIRCHPDLAETVRTSTEASMTTSGFTGRLVVIGDPEIALGDGKIEWADGGLIRDGAAIAASIDERIYAYLDARGILRLKETSNGQ